MIYLRWIQSKCSDKTAVPRGQSRAHLLGPIAWVFALQAGRQALDKALVFGLGEGHIADLGHDRVVGRTAEQGQEGEGAPQRADKGDTTNCM